MDNNDSNIKSQTGGLKLMTVFIAVLALHVVVIGGFTVYHLMSGGSTDADLTSADKSNKSLNGSTMDSSLPGGNPTDKSATTPTPPTEVATIPATTATTPAPDATSSTSSTAATTSTPTPTAATSSAPAPTTTPAPAAAPTVTTPTATPPPAPATEVADQGPQTPTGPISPDLAPPAEPAPVSEAPAAPAPSVALAAPGPVHMPPADFAPAVQEIYVVKITDSYKKIAHRHHITVAELKEANHIHDNVLHTGQRLVIPSDKKYVTENASTSTLDAAPSAPVLNESAAPMTTGLTSSSPTMDGSGIHHHTYTVVKGDTLTRIAHRFRTTASAIMAENGITDPTKLAIGKKLRIPSEESRSARNNTPAPTQPGQVQAKGNAPTAQLANFAN